MPITLSLLPYLSLSIIYTQTNKSSYIFISSNTNLQTRRSKPSFSNKLSTQPHICYPQNISQHPCLLLSREEPTMNHEVVSATTSDDKRYPPPPPLSDDGTERHHHREVVVRRRPNRRERERKKRERGGEIEGDK
ncbi:hypothetical protein HanPI659440_Chr16g0633861 [Helianthus annuus]|nr:hypothetical protein HanPI659440_Chr16g0633861 [Helianthus annuus]